MTGDHLTPRMIISANYQKKKKKPRFRYDIYRFLLQLHQLDSKLDSSTRPFKQASIKMDYSPFTLRPKSHYFFSSPLAALIYPLHNVLLRLRAQPAATAVATEKKSSLRVVCISDTHSLQYPHVPDGDLLIHAGDMCNNGSLAEIQAAVDWLKELPHAQKVVIAGNHDGFFDPKVPSPRGIEEVAGRKNKINALNWGDNIHYLQHSSITLNFFKFCRSITIYGAPDIPAIVPFGPEHAFVYPPNQDVWSGSVSFPHRNIATATSDKKIDILVTHTPPLGHLDLSPVYSTGCPYLLAEAWRVRPKLHVFGHVHAAYGAEPVFWDNAQRAWERLCARRRSRAAAAGLSGTVLGVLRDLVDLPAWIDALRVLVYGVWGVLTSRSRRDGNGWMVNAACMFRDSGQLRNPPQVFDI